MKNKSFKDRLYTLIKESTKYTYPEKGDELFPNFDQPVEIDNCLFKRFAKFKRALRILKKNYDIKGLEYTYNNLSDEYSKEIFLRVIARPLFKKISLRFPLYYSTCWKNLTKYENYIVKDENIKRIGQKFDIYNLKGLGHDVNLLYSPTGILINYDLEQYRYKNEVFAKESDFVIDGGACYGDTAVYFANTVKESGKVFSFEFIKENLEIYNKNMELNPNLNNRIELIKRPLGTTSNNKLYAIENGPGSCITDKKTEENAEEFLSLSIDDLVKERNLEKIDFIKLDIEGAELATLKGAVNTLKKHKPNLAICVYHKTSDLWEIPRFIKETVPEYKLYLDHFTITPWETVLFAKAEK